MTDSYNQNYLESLLKEFEEIVAKKLSPIALQYEYSKVPLENAIKWKPIVLILGNYSSGKSTLVNELLGRDVQDTGQAPTDDSFTVLSYGDSPEVEEREGRVLLNESIFPFERLKQFGSRFTSHFRLKRVHSDLLKNLAIIDTPGMLDSISEKDRGYDYQKVVGELAQLADLILVLFDPHKAGTVKESHHSLRETLPSSTSEDRVIFVLNRIDECASLADLIRVYGTLCWNLSQMTGRKDIPKILLTCSEKSSEQKSAGGQPEYMELLNNQRKELVKSVAAAPAHRLDHLAAYTETHIEKLDCLLEALEWHLLQKRRFSWKWFGGGGAFWVLLALIAGLVHLFVQPILPVASIEGLVALLAGASVFSLVFWVLLVNKALSLSMKNRWIAALDSYAGSWQYGKKEIWDSIRELAQDVIRSKNIRLKEIKRQRADLAKVRKRVGKDLRQAIEEAKSR